MKNLFLSLLISSCFSFSALASIHAEAPLNITGKKSFLVSWIKDLDPQYQTGNFPIGLNSPGVAEGIVYSGHNAGKMMAIDARNGRVLWEKSEGGSFSSTPAIYKDQVVYGTTFGRVVSRNRLTGELKFEIDLGSSIESAGTIANGKIFFQLRNHKVFALDVETGKILWAYNRSIPFITTLQNASTPVVDGSKLFVGMADGYLVCLSTEDGSMVWDKKLSNGTKFIDVDSTPIVDNGNLLVSSMAGPFYILSSNSGKVVKSIEEQATRAPLKMSNGNFILPLASGEIAILSDHYDLIMKKKISAKPITAINFVKDRVVVATLGRNIYFLDKENFESLDTFDLGHYASAVFGDIKVSGDQVFFISARNKLYSFKL